MVAGTAQPLAGHLARHEVEALLEPVRHFWLFEPDALVFEYVFYRERVGHPSCGQVTLFGYGTSPGTGAPCGFGNGAYLAAVADVDGLDLDDIHVRPRSLVTRLQALLEPKLRIDGAGARRALVATGAGRSSASEVLGADLVGYLAASQPRLCCEIDGSQVVVYRRARRGDRDRELFARQALTVLDLLDERRG